MKEAIKKNIDVWRSDYVFKTYVSSAISTVISSAFTIYNGFLGIYYSSLWNGAICVYYVLLAIVRGITLRARRYSSNEKKHIRRVCFLTHIILLVINLSLIVPIMIMIKGGRSCDFGIIPAISMATYTIAPPN